jgi:hypothetical protein
MSNRMWNLLRPRPEPPPRTVTIGELLAPQVDPVDGLATHLERLLVAEAPVWDQPVGETPNALVVSVSDAARTIAHHLAHTGEFARA